MRLFSGSRLLFPTSITIVSTVAVVIASRGTLLAAPLLPGDLVVIDLEAVFHVDPVTGDRTILSDAATGGGPAFGRLDGVVVSADGDVFVTNWDGVNDVGSILRVDPLTGDRTVVSGSGVGGGPEFVRAVGIAMEPSGGILAVAPDDEALFRVDLANGDRVVVSGEGRGEGPAFDEPQGVAVSSSGAVYVTDDENDDEPLEEVVFRVVPSTGERMVVADNSTGGAPFFDVLGSGITTDGSDNILLVDSDAILRVDPLTGIRTLVSGQGAGSGPEFVLPRGLAFDPSGRMLVADQVAGILSVDPQTGGRTIFSGGMIGSGPEFTAVRGVAVVPPPPVLGDLNCDGHADFDDIEAFVLGIRDAAAYEAAFGLAPAVKGDTDRDGDFDFDDIPGFVAILGVGEVQSVPEPSSTAQLIAVGLALFVARMQRGRRGLARHMVHANGTCLRKRLRR